MSRSRRSTLAFVLVLVGLSAGLQGCFLFGVHDDWQAHRGFAYETPERVSQGHAHHHRSSGW